MMLKLYRGLVDIFIKQSLVQEQEFVKHVRSDTAAVIEAGTIGTRGFWNLMLEIVSVLFTKTVFLFGLVIVCALAIISFPLYGIWQGVMMMINHRASFEPIMLEEPVKQEPKLDKK